MSKKKKTLTQTTLQCAYSSDLDISLKGWIQWCLLKRIEVLGRRCGWCWMVIARVPHAERTDTACRRKNQTDVTEKAFCTVCQRRLFTRRSLPSNTSFLNIIYVHFFSMECNIENACGEDRPCWTVDCHPDKTHPVYYTNLRKPFGFLWLLRHALIDHLRVPSIPDSAGEKTQPSPELCVMMVNRERRVTTGHLWNGKTNISTFLMGRFCSRDLQGSRHGTDALVVRTSSVPNAPVLLSSVCICVLFPGQVRIFVLDQQVWCTTSLFCCIHRLFVHFLPKLCGVWIVIVQLQNTQCRLYRRQVPVCVRWRLRPGSCHNGQLQRAPARPRCCLSSAGAPRGSQPPSRLGVWTPDVVANLVASAPTVQGVLPAGACVHQVLNYVQYTEAIVDNQPG